MITNDSPGFLMSKITKASFIFYFLLYVSMTPLLIYSIPGFIDFESYSNIISGGWAWPKYFYEPISAGFLMIFSYFSLSAFEMYLVTWFIAILFFFIVLFSLGKEYGVLYVFVILNPVVMILVQFSRQYLSFLFFLMAMFFLFAKYKPKVFLLLSILSHTASSLFGLFFYSLFKSSFYRFLLLIAIATLGFSVLTLFFYPQYAIHDAVKGRGRVFIVVMYFLFFLFLSVKRVKICILFISLCFFFVFSYYLSPQAGRFAPYFIVLLTFYGFYSFKNKGNVVLIHVFFLVNILFSFYIVSMGKFGFSG